MAESSGALRKPTSRRRLLRNSSRARSLYLHTFELQICRRRSSVEWDPSRNMADKDRRDRSSHMDGGTSSVRSEDESKSARKKMVAVL